MSSAAQPRILLVEDDSFNQVVLQGMLEIIVPDAAITIVSDGVQALAALSAGRFDAIFSDVDMPVMSGTELVRAIKADRRVVAPVIAVTAFAVVGDRERLLIAGFDDYISKPIEFDRLQAVVANLFGEVVQS